MRFIIFSDLDGTFLDHKTYSYGGLKSYIDKLKFNSEVIFVSSKTYEEIINIQNSLSINNPFIVENGACIYFPIKYFRNNPPKKYKLIKYKNHLSFKLTTLNINYLTELLKKIKNKYKFCFYSDLSKNKIVEITNLSSSNAKLSQMRVFSNPIYWKDLREKINDFKNDVYSLNKNLVVVEGGRFLHILDKYNKGIALKKFLEIIDENVSSYITISLGDSENDIPMLELTDFSCIIKSRTNKNFVLKNKNIFKSNLMAPYGWKESIEHILNKEIKNF